MMFNGLRVILKGPRTLVRSWRERLFTRPWRPWVRTKLVPDPVVGPDDIYRIGGTLIVGERAYQKIKQETRELGTS